MCMLDWSMCQELDRAAIVAGLASRWEMSVGWLGM